MHFAFVKSSVDSHLFTGGGKTAEQLLVVNTWQEENRKTQDMVTYLTFVNDIALEEGSSLKDTELFKKHLEDRFWFSKFSDETRLKLSADDYVNDISLKGEFIRRVMASDLPEALRDRVIQCGLAALSGREVL